MLEFDLGDIVALQSHPYNNEINNVVFSGEPQLISPLMVVIEVLVETRTQHDERTGGLVSEKGQSQCKCIWYSNKSHQFEETWLSSKLIKIIKKNANVNLDEDYVRRLINTEVTFKTSNIELGKKKSSLLFKNSSANGSTSITPLLSFVAPVMQMIQVTEVKKSDVKEPIYDSKDGRQKRFFPKIMVKCKWFNSSSDKMSEKLLPLEALSFVKKIDHVYLAFLKASIDSSKYLKNAGLIISPKMLTNRNGRYYLIAYSYIVNSMVEFKISSVANLVEIEKYYTDKGPYYDPLTSVIFSKTDAIAKAISNNQYLRISYKKKDGTITTRTLTNLSIQKANNLKGVMTDYLQAYCHLRKAERLFKIKRIQQLEVLDLIVT